MIVATAILKLVLKVFFTFPCYHVCDKNFSISNSNIKVSVLFEIEMSLELFKFLNLQLKNIQIPQ